jgi:hypothetical protein
MVKSNKRPISTNENYDGFQRHWKTCESGIPERQIIENRCLYTSTRKAEGQRMRKKWMAIVLLLAATILFFPLYPAGADDAAPVDEAADLAQDLTNPLADLMTIPIQMNYDQDIGAGDGGERLRTNIQPVIPFHLNEDWNLISRTIVPVIHQDDIFPGEGSQFGLGDVSLSLFLSPKKPTANGLLWGIGPILLLPTATDSLLGGKKWGGAHRGRADHAGAMDHGHAGQPCLVHCRRQRPAGHQQHLYPAVRVLYLVERLDPVGPIRK